VAPAPTFPDHAPTVPELLRAGRERHGDRECVITPEGRLGYAELDERSRALAARLLDAGVGKGTRVGILLPNGIDWVLAWMAAARLGAVTVTLSTFATPPELVRTLRHADVQVLLGVAGFLQHDYAAGLEAEVPPLRSAVSPLRVIALPQLRRVLFAGDRVPAWAEPLHATAAGPSDALELVDAMGADVTPADIAVVTYTSGTTADPKGVVHTHGTIVRHAANMAAVTGIDAESRIWTPMPLCWVGGLIHGLLRALSAGGCFLTQAAFEPGVALRMLGAERVSVVAGWPGIFRALADHPDFPSTDLRALRTGWYDGIDAAFRPPDPGLVIGSLGMSETAGPHTSKTRTEEIAGAPEAYRGTFGHVVPGTEHRIVDPDTGEDVPEGGEGEVYLRGYSLMHGLYKKERADVFDPDGWYRSGDRGLFRDGWFFFTGRQSALIKTAGANVAPEEVERCLMELADVRAAFVVGVPDPVRGQDVAALVVPAAGPVDLGAAHAHARERLASYKRPRHILEITDDQVPWMASQKVDQRGLVALAVTLAAEASAPLATAESAPA
jgi:acyl-CoA synthetase (AMP-forming)/AMP-acid ligase II